MVKRCLIITDSPSSIIASNDMFGTYLEYDIPGTETDFYALTSDGHGNWVCGHYGLYYSHDDGVTWVLSNYTDSPEHDYIASIATDGLGNWVAVEGLNSTDIYEHFVLLSTDNGETWSVAAGGMENARGVAYGNGVWIMTTIDELYRSTNITNWTKIIDDSANLSFQQVAADGAGVWCAAVQYGDTWVESDPPGDGGYPGQVWRSDDNGLTWAKVLQSVLDVGYWAIATDKAGVWCVARDYLYVGYTGEIHRSTDNGATWDSVATGATMVDAPNLAADGEGNWAIATWDTNDQDLVLLSDDNGATWTIFSPVTHHWYSSAVAFGGSLCPAPEINVGDVDFV